MSSDQPPPYRPHFPEGPSAPGFPPSFGSQPAAFPGSSYQLYPQTFTGGGDHPYYHGSPGVFMSQPGYAGYQGGTPGPDQWGGAKSYGELPKHTVFMVGQQEQHHAVKDSCLKACSALLCCCCLWDMLTSHLCCPLTSDLH